MRLLTLLALVLLADSAAFAAGCSQKNLNRAIAADDIEQLELLSEPCTAEWNRTDFSGRTPLFSAVELGAVKAIHWLIEQQKVSVNLSDQQKLSPLHLARTKPIAEALLKAGAPVNALDQWQRTPFEVTLALENWELLDALRAHGAEIRASDIEWASDYYKFAILEYLADRATPEEIRGTGRYFRFFFFHEDSYQKLATKFLQKGADLNLAKTITTHRGLLEFYVDEYVKDESNYKKYGLNAIDFVVKNGAHVNTFDPRSGRPVAHYVLNKRDFATNAKILDLFLEHGLNINQANPLGGGQTPLMELAAQLPESRQDHEYITQMATYLIAHGAGPNFQSTDGRTPLHWAVRWANLPLARVLAPLSTLLADVNGHNALQYAYRRLAEAPSEQEQRELAAIIQTLKQHH